MDLASQAATASGRRPIDGWHSRPESAINTERPSLAYIDYNHKEHTFPPPSHNRKVSMQNSDEFENRNPLDDLRNARRAVNDEHEQTVRKAVKSYYEAIFWSLYLSTAVIMEGYDTSLVYSFFGLPAFAKKYGAPQQDGLYSLSAPWQRALAVWILKAGIAIDN
ncbi:hypothetical protein FANTH_790 [Fusarium anthophilum]|uniref:Uncharacterized protein n=1 Tax=Fusarium anthophilum TaxID=48485 RepID=A0A8H4ZXA3_9HYPO|nr:hypothetical protein FANTH_790 [Fusarium anthophilum]